jgi:hypothetical protein
VGMKANANQNALAGGWSSAGALHRFVVFPISAARAGLRRSRRISDLGAPRLCASRSRSRIISSGRRAVM